MLWTSEKERNPCAWSNGNDFVGNDAKTYRWGKSRLTASGNNNFDPTSVSAPALPQKNPPWPNFLKHTTSAEFQPKTFKLISYVRREAGLPRKWKQPVPYQRGSCCAISAPRLTKGSAVAKISKRIASAGHFSSPKSPKVWNGWSWPDSGLHSNGKQHFLIPFLRKAFNVQFSLLLCQKASAVAKLCTMHYFSSPKLQKWARKGC